MPILKRVLVLLTAAIAVAGAQALAQKPAPFGLAPAPAVTTPPPGGIPPARRLGPGGSVFIAGDGFSLEQAVEDGIRQGSGSAFAVLVLGAEISKLGIHGATSETSAVLLKAIKSGGTLYVCERDVKRQGFATHEFVPGVQVVRGFSKAETKAPGNKPGPPGSAPLAPMFRMRAICTE